MTGWTLAAFLVLVGAVVPATVLGLRGEPLPRLVGLVQLGTTTALFLMLFAQAVKRPDYLIVPLALVLVGFAGALVFARLLVPRR